jgi:hypothetical protein
MFSVQSAPRLYSYNGERKKKLVGGWSRWLAVNHELQVGSGSS